MSLKKFKILSIDGGGIRGIFPAMILAEYEAKLKSEGVANWQVYQNFDLICGTSTGGIMAIALGLGIPAKEIYEMYLNNADKIFGNKRAGLRQLWVATHKRDELEKLVRETFAAAHPDGADPTLEDCKTPVMIPIYDLLEGRPSVLKSKYHPAFVRDFHIPAYQAAMATSAAPTYFDPYSSRYIDGNELEKSFRNKVDGGVWANNPTLNGIIESQKAFEVELKDLAVLSIGTGHQKFCDTGIKQNKGIFNWILRKVGLKKKSELRSKFGILYWIYSDGKKRLIDLFMQGQSQQIQNLISLMKKGIDKREADNFTYLRLDTELNESCNIEMDETEKAKLNSLAEKAVISFQYNASEIMKHFSGGKRQFD